MYFKNLPATPELTGSPQILKRLVDGLAFRYYLATKDLSLSETEFRPISSSMSIDEVNQHIFHLVRMTCKSMDLDIKVVVDLNSFEEVTKSTLGKLEILSKGLNDMTEQQLIEKKVYLKRLDKHFSFWYLINGFIADALTHVGQINSWRRMAGNPVSRISPFTGAEF